MGLVEAFWTALLGGATIASIAMGYLVVAMRDVRSMANRTSAAVAEIAAQMAKLNGRLGRVEQWKDDKVVTDTNVEEANRRRHDNAGADRNQIRHDVNLLREGNHKLRNDLWGKLLRIEAERAFRRRDEPPDDGDG